MTEPFPNGRGATWDPTPLVALRRIVQRMGWDGGSTRAWRALRAAVLARDGYRCRAHEDGWCARAHRRTPHRCDGSAPLAGGHAHHTLGRARTGDDPAFIVAACGPCNLHIGDPDHAHDPKNKAVTRW